MPLLNKVPFERAEIRENIKDHEEVFYCAATGEVFEDYESFCERVLIVNSVVWTCSLTGKSNMTFEEATACEEHAREMLKEFPVELRIPALYLASLTQRTSLENLAEDVFSFAKDRYFVGESVEVNFKGDVWTESHVLQVIAPSKTDVKVDSSGVRFVSLPASVFRYEVEAYVHSDSGEQEVSAQQVRRKKGCFSRDRNRLYVKQFAEAGPGGIWRIKKEALQKYGIPRVKFENIFVGNPPVFQVSKNARVKKNQASMDRYLTVSNSQNKKKSPSKVQVTPQKQTALKVKEKYRQVNAGGVKKRYRKPMVMSVEKLQMLRDQQLEERKKKLEERVIERAKLREEKLRLAELMKQWSRQREDLECEDLKALPVPLPVQCRIPNEHFGDFLVVVEFFTTFSEVLNTREFFPYGVTLELVERALLDHEVAGPFSDMLQFLLQQLFRMQDEEDDEIQTYSATDVNFTDASDVSTSEAIRLATAAAGWSQKYQGTALCKLALDSVTVSEVLRLHLLSSGGRCSEVNCKWRYQQRGGYTSSDDPGLRLRINSAHILRSLAARTVFDLPLGDKLLVMTCLMDQILTYASLRDVVDERCEKYRLVKTELKVQQLTAIKREKELAALRIKQRKDRKLVQKGDAAQVDPAETEAEMARLEKDIARRHTEMQRKISEVNTVAAGHRVVPLGTDRAHRRYWVFNSCPGLFVEHDPTLAGPCMDAPTPYSTDQDPMVYVRRLFEEEKCTGGSDKENEEDKAPTPKKPRLEDAAPSMKVEALDCEVLLCSASDECPVHCVSAGRTRWAFISSVDHLQLLLDGLNTRGVREGELRQNILDDWQKIQQAVAKCPVSKLVPGRGEECLEERKSVRTMYNARYMDANLNFPSGTPAEEIFELTMRDLITDLEEKIHCGGLGTVKVASREAWRAAIMGRSYDKQCSQVTWAAHQSIGTTDNSSSAKHNGRGSGGSPETEVEPIDCKDPGRFLGAQELPCNPVVQDLASAILQLGQSLETKYRQKPLAPEGDDRSQIERWEMSLMNSTCFSQLFVHYYTLESSIQWSKSALNANCRLCRRRGDAENMLLCDNCNKGHHLYCLKPKLTKIPKGDWFCPKCRPEVKTPRTVPKRRTIFLAEEEEEDQTEEEEEDGSRDPPLEVCHKCGEGGHVLCCDTESCARVFHIECLEPPLRKVPRGKWFCPVCKQREATTQAAGSKAGDREWQPQEPLRSRRGCANAAVAKISEFAKRIRSASWDNDSSSGTSEELIPSRRSARMSLEPDLDLPLNNALLQDLLTEVMHHKDAWPFLRPVARAQVPDYHLIIKRPMDLGTMKNKLNMLNYSNNSEFIADAILVFENCKMYNQLDAVEYKAGVSLRKFFKKRCKELGLHSLDLQEELP